MLCVLIFNYKSKIPSAFKKKKQNRPETYLWFHLIIRAITEALKTAAEQSAQYQVMQKAVLNTLVPGALTSAVAISPPTLWVCCSTTLCVKAAEL